MSAIGPGDYVECVSAKNAEDIGRIFIVEDTFPGMGCRKCGKPGAVTIRGRLNWRGGRYICVFSLRSIYRPKAEIIEGFLVPCPELECVP